jgi:glycerol-3-phosphate acyltransferase PlsY
VGPRQEVQFVLFLAVLVWISHRANIGRLLKGREPKIGQGKKAAENDGQP